MEYAIGFDFSRNMVRVLNLGDMSYQELPTHRMFVNSGNYAGMLKFAFKNNDISGSDVRIVLPDSAVACDYITTPSLKYHTRNALKVEFENIYTNEQELKYNWDEFFSTKNYTTAKYVITRKSVLESVKQGVQEINCTLKGITWSPNGVVNSFMALGGKATNVNTVSGGAEETKSALGIFKSLLGKKQQEEQQAKDPLPNTVLFVDVQKNTTRFVLSGKSSTLCALSQPFGYSVLYPNKVVQEYMITNHDVSELAVLNAIEIAKRKKQTIAVASDLTDEEDEADEAYMEMLESLTNKDGAPVPKKKTEEDDSADFYNDPEENKQAEMPVSNEPKPFEKVQKKQEKKYPKFMLRDKPDSPEGYVMENFRMIQKYILLFVQNTENISYFNRPQRVVLNVPAEFSFIADKLNEEEDNGVKFELLENGGNAAPDAMDNLDLYGASFCDRYNKLYNFT